MCIVKSNHKNTILSNPWSHKRKKNHFSWPIQQLPSPRQECNHLSRKADQVANHFAKAANQKKQWITNHCAQAASATYKSHSAIIHLWCFDIQRLAEWFTSFLIPDFFFFPEPFDCLAFVWKAWFPIWLTLLFLRWNPSIYWGQRTETARETDLHQVLAQTNYKYTLKCKKHNYKQIQIQIPKLTNILPQIPDAGVGKGVPHEPLPHAAPPDRDGSPTLPHREADQNLVPEQVRLFCLCLCLYKKSIKLKRVISDLKICILNNQMAFMVSYCATGLILHVGRISVHRLDDSID